MPFIGRQQCNRAQIRAKRFLPIVGAALALSLLSAPAQAATPLRASDPVITSGSTSWAVLYWHFMDRLYQILKRYQQPTPQDANAAMADATNHYNAYGVPGDLLLDEVFAIKDAAVNLLSLLDSPPETIDPVIAENFRQVLYVLADL